MLNSLDKIVLRKSYVALIQLSIDKIDFQFTKWLTISSTIFWQCFPWSRVVNQFFELVFVALERCVWDPCAEMKPKVEENDFLLLERT